MTKRICDGCGKDLQGKALFRCHAHWELDYCWNCFEEHQNGHD